MPIPDGTICASCRQHPATVMYDNQNIGLMAITHQFYEYWCRCCVLRAQIAHIEKQIAQLPALRYELDFACKGQTPDPMTG